MGVEEAELPGLIADWRRSNPHITKFWWDVDAAAIKAVTEKQKTKVEKKGYPIVMHCHDEIIAEVPEGTGSVDEMCEVMAVQPEWAEGLPLRADGYECSFYQKQ